MTTSRPIHRLIHRVALALLVLVLGMLRSVAQLQRWRARPADRPRGWLAISRGAVLPLVCNLSWALLILVGLPHALGPLLVGSGVVALGWRLSARR